LSKKNKNESLTNMDVTNLLISSLHLLLCYRLETISINVHKIPVERFEYTVAPRRRPPRYDDHFNAAFPMLMYYRLLH